MVNNKKIPMRLCIGCGEMKNKRDMMRILKTPEEVERFYESFNKEPRKLIDRTLTSPEKEREAVEKLKQLLSR